MDMKSVREIVEIEWIIQKSRFIGFLVPVTAVEQAQEALEKMRLMHPSASHICYAMILSAPQAVEKASDDGEPQKTAGVPMLEILKKNQLTNVLAISVRYFGGIKLGAGGLLRAYAKTIRSCVEKAEFTFPVELLECVLTVDYAQSGPLGTYLRQVAELTQEAYGDAAMFFFTCPADQYDSIAAEIKKRTSSDLSIEIRRSSVHYRSLK